MRANDSYEVVYSMSGNQIEVGFKKIDYFWVHVNENHHNSQGES